MVLGWFRRVSKVRVSFIDTNSGRVIAILKLKPEDLPERFDESSTVDLDGKKWGIVRAEPALREEFGKRGRLTLWVRPILEGAAINPANLLYSLPTIANEIPPSVEVPAGGEEEILRIAEDDWRQIEFVSLALEPLIDDALVEIRRVHEEDREGVGFRRLHLRKEPVEPLRSIPLEKGEVLKGLGPDARRFEGVGFHGVRDRIEGGFAFETGDLLKGYGLEREGRVVALCLLAPEVRRPHPARLLEVARRHELCLVDWCRAAKMLPGEEEYRRYFER